MITEESANLHTVVVSIVNPQGIITTITDNNNSSEPVEAYSNESYILENCDETMFRPVITVINTVNSSNEEFEDCSKPVEVPLELVVPVIDERLLEEKKRKKEDEQKEKARRQVLKVEKEAEENKKDEKIDAKAENITDVKKSDEKTAVFKKEEASTQSRKNKKAQKYNKKSLDDDNKKNTKEALSVTKSSIAQIKLEKSNEKEQINEPPSKVQQEVTKEIEILPKVEPVAETVSKIEGIIEKSTAVSSELNTKIELEVIEELIKPDERQEDEIVEISTPVAENFEVIEEETKLEDAKEVQLRDDIKTQSDPKPEPLLVESIETLSTPEELPIKKQNETHLKDSWKNKNKKGKKKNHAQSSAKFESTTLDFPPLESLSTELKPLEDYNKELDQDAIMKISKHEIIGDDEIQIIPHEDAVEIHESPQKSNSDIEIIEETFAMTTELETVTEIKETFAINDDIYDDIDDELPPLEAFDAPFDDFNGTSLSSAAREDDNTERIEKQTMKKKMSELLKDTNMVFAMCSSLKELKVDEDSKSMNSSSHIQRSTSSSLTTNTTTSTFASANSNQQGEGHDSDYKSLDLELEEAIICETENDVYTANDNETVFKMPEFKKAPSYEKDDPEEISSFEATSSETDDSSKKSSIETKFKREDDEELRPLLGTSITSLSTPLSTVDMTVITNTITTEANKTPTLPDINQKIEATSNNNSGNGKRKNRKKRR